jgi:hypothetical protein
MLFQETPDAGFDQHLEIVDRSITQVGVLGK